MLNPKDWSAIQTTIAHQLHHMKPEALVPGRDVFLVGEEDGTLTVITADVVMNVRYDAGRDTYDVRRKADASADWSRPLINVYCDQLGELAFGSDAQQWTMPFGAIIDGDGNVVAEF